MSICYPGHIILLSTYSVPPLSWGKSCATRVGPLPADSFCSPWDPALPFLDASREEVRRKGARSLCGSPSYPLVGDPASLPLVGMSLGDKHVDGPVHELGAR